MPMDRFPPDDGGGEVLATPRGFYKIVKKIAKGSYAAIFEVIGRSDKMHLAAKCELLSEKKKFLIMDFCVLREAARLKSRHFPGILERGKIDGRFSYLVMELLGRSLADLQGKNDDTVLKMAQQTLVAIEQLHRIGFIHRDIKPANFAMGCGSRSNSISILDFGFARQYVDKQTNRIRQPRKEVAFRGSHVFASLDAMNRREQSRKDDLESWFYMIVELKTQQLPWKIHQDSPDKIRQMKLELRQKKFPKNFLKNCPEKPFTKIFEHIVELDYYSTPDYKFLNNILMETMKMLKITWEKPLAFSTIPYKEPIEIPGNGQPDGFQETPEKEKIKMEKLKETATKSGIKSPKKETVAKQKKN